MENVRKYFEYLESKVSTNQHIEWGDTTATKHTEYILNKLLSLPKEKDEMYLNGIKRCVLFNIDNAIEEYAYNNKNYCFFNINYLDYKLFLEWIKPIIRKASNEIADCHDIYAIINIDEFTRLVKDRYFESKEDEEIYNLRGYHETIISIDISNGNEDESFKSYFHAMNEFSEILSFGIGLMYPDFDIPEYNKENHRKWVYGNSTTENHKRKVEILDMRKPFSSIMTQAQLMTMFRLLRDNGIIDRTMNNTQLATLTTSLAGGSHQTARACLGGQNANHINMTLTNKEQARQIQDVLSDIITQIEEEKKDILK